MCHDFVGQELEQDSAQKDNYSVDIDKDHLLVFKW